MTFATRTLHRGAVHRASRAGAFWGLLARGGCYLVLAWLGVRLALGDRGEGEDVDARGAMHDLAHTPGGTIALVVLAIGFAGFALWHFLLAVTKSAEPTTRRAADALRGLVDAAMAVLAISFVASSLPDTGAQQDTTWTARILDWPAGPAIVATVGAAIALAGLVLAWRSLDGGPLDEPAVLEAAPRETPTVRTLAAAGNVARGGVVVLIGFFVIQAAVDYDPSKPVGLDGALGRLTDGGIGDVAVLLVALGLAAFGLASIARAVVNRSEVARDT